ncbi:hypothetical protein F5B22DRAFT_637688 [Xylaria bambusicola]|uniref:uncharacterized protein n=1 Tax=Xylaria bambusicola TaxID=326684 RepID=UPI002008A55C|nr:uncharacterized protein F5B22DRAFT_637688 [Xylaria bambusicola]KAI0512650.1 hypothetical protein F5B22DRAFT_637688 [Xylaria bambusicola]
MAPQLLTPSTLVFDSRTQIISNCKFLINKGDNIEVVTSKDPSGKLFKALAVQCGEESRELLLESEHCENAQKAVESLHTKSCEAVHNYTAINGFARPRDLKTTFLEPSLNDNDAASIISGRSDSSTAAISEWGSSGDEAMMLKHASRTNRASKDRQRPSGRPGSYIATTTGAHELLGETRSRGSLREVTFDPAPPRGRAVRPARSCSPPLVFRQGPPPPPPGNPGTNGPSVPPPSMRNVPMPIPSHPYPSGMAVGPPHPGRPQNNMNPPMPPAQHFQCLRVPGYPADGPSFPTPLAPIRPTKPAGPSASNNYHGGNGNGHSNHLSRPLSVFHPQVRTHAVRITVHWLRHGQHRIIAQCQPTRESLQSAAVTDVRLNPDAFTSDGNSSSSHNANNRDIRGITALRAHVRQAVFAGEPYDMRTFHGQDLARLFHVMAADDNMPSFEVVVEELPPHDAEDSDYDGASNMGFP